MSLGGVGHVELSEGFFGLIIGNNPIKLGSLRIPGNIGTQYTTEDGRENGSNED